MSVTHAFVSAVVDLGAANELSPNDWNANHNFAGGALGSILYRDTGASDGASWLAAVAAGAYLRAAGVATAPVWSTLILPNAATATRLVYAASANTYGETASMTFDGTTLKVGIAATTIGKLQAYGQNNSLNLTAVTGTDSIYSNYSNTSGTLYAGVESSVGGFAFSGSTAYAAVVGSGSAVPFQILVNGIVVSTFDSTGSFQVGGTAARAGTAGTKRIDIFNGTAPTSTLANGISIYSSAGECYIMDAAGNATLQTPHNDAGEWVFLSKNTVTGKTLLIDMERMMRALNARFGWDYVKDSIDEGEVI